MVVLFGCVITTSHNTAVSYNKTLLIMKKVNKNITDNEKSHFESSTFSLYIVDVSKLLGGKQMLSSKCHYCTCCGYHCGVGHSVQLCMRHAKQHPNCPINADDGTITKN